MTVRRDTMMDTRPSANHSFEHIRELFTAFGPVDIRRMFGGAGIYAHGIMIGIVADDVIYLKADESTRAAFEQENCAPFVYAAKGGRRAVMSYWRLPEKLYDSADELAEWARAAFAVAERAAARKK